MVELQLRMRGIDDARVLRAFAAVPRDEFVPDELRDRAYEDTPLAIGHRQTISQPYVVAVAAELLALAGDERVLDVGTGSGYAAAILAKLAREVHTIERIPALADAARARLARLGYDNVHVHCGDGTEGWPEAAPYDAIAVAASAPRPPRPLLDQLAIGGRLVLPVGDERMQRLVLVTRTSELVYDQQDRGAVRFVPLVGAHGWPP